MKDIKKAGIFVIFVYIALILGISALYRFDSDETNSNIIREFISNEAKYQYYECADSLSSIADSSISISTMLRYYGNIRFDMELSRDDVKDNKLSTQDDIDARLEELLPSNISQANDYIMPYVYTYAYYDILVDLDKDSDMYWELSYKTLFKLSIHQYLLSRNPTGWLYSNCKSIALVLVVVLMVVFSMTMGALIVYYMKLIGRKDKEGMK